MAIYTGIFNVQPQDTDNLNAHPGYGVVNRFASATDTEGVHEFMLVDTQCGIGKIPIEAIAENRCVINDPTVLSAGRRKGYVF